MLSISKILISLIKPPTKRQEPNWYAYWLVVAVTFFLFHLPHAGKLQALADIPFFFEGFCSLLIAYIGFMYASKSDIFFRESGALKTKVAAVALEKSVPIADALETFIRITQRISLLIKIKNSVDFKSTIVTSIRAVTRLHIRLGGIVHACLAPRLIPTPIVLIA